MEAYGLGAAARHPDRPGARDPRRVLRRASRTSPSTWSETVREAKARGYTTTIFGRRRQIPELSSDNFRIRQMGERMAQNAPVQGSRGRHLQARDDRPRPRARRRAASRAGWCSPCTTSSCSRCRSTSANASSRVVRDTMENVTELRVPLVGRHRLRPQLGRRQEVVTRYCSAGAVSKNTKVWSSSAASPPSGESTAAILSPAAFASSRKPSWVYQCDEPRPVLAHRFRGARIRS